MNGNIGDDSLHGGKGDDILHGKTSDVTLHGDEDDETLYGDEVDDTLYGGGDNDTYIYGKGYGNDTISDSGGANRIKFTNLMPDDMAVFYPPSGNDAVLTITETGETLTIRNFRSAEYWRDFTLEFENGRTGKIDYGSASIMLDPLTVTFGIGNGNAVVPNDVIGEIKFDGLSPADLTAFYSDDSAVLTITSTGVLFDK